MYYKRALIYKALWFMLQNRFSIHCRGLLRQRPFPGGMESITQSTYHDSYNRPETFNLYFLIRRCFEMKSKFFKLVGSRGNLLGAWLPVLFFCVALVVSGCGSGAGTSDNGTPTEPDELSSIDTRGGDCGGEELDSVDEQGGWHRGCGGDGGDVDLFKDGSAGNVEIVRVGQANAGFNTADPVCNSGSNPAAVSGELGLTEGYGGEEGDLYVGGGYHIFIRGNGDQGTDREATGLEVADGATLILPLNYEGYKAKLEFVNDICNNGTITVDEENPGEMGGLKLYAASYIGGENSALDTSGINPGQEGGSIKVSVLSFFNKGEINSSGADAENDPGGDAGYVKIKAEYAIENTGDVLAQGGDATEGVIAPALVCDGDCGYHGGDGNYIKLLTDTGHNYNGGLLASNGGDGTGCGGNGGDVYLNSLSLVFHDGPRPHTVKGDVKNVGDIDAAGGDSGNCGYYVGGESYGGYGHASGGDVQIMAAAGDIASNAEISTMGGDTGYGKAGSGGDVKFVSMEGRMVCFLGCHDRIDWDNWMATNGNDILDDFLDYNKLGPAGDIEVSGDILTLGGNAAEGKGGTGGDVKATSMKEFLSLESHAFSELGYLVCQTHSHDADLQYEPDGYGGEELVDVIIGDQIPEGPDAGCLEFIHFLSKIVDDTNFPIDQRISFLGYGDVLTGGGDAAGAVAVLTSEGGSNPGKAGNGGDVALASTCEEGEAGVDVGGANIVIEADVTTWGGDGGSVSEEVIPDGYGGEEIIRHDEIYGKGGQGGDVSLETDYECGPYYSAALLGVPATETFLTGVTNTSGGNSVRYTPYYWGDSGGEWDGWSKPNRAGDVWLWGYNGVTIGSIAAEGGDDLTEEENDSGFGGKGGEIAAASELGPISIGGPLSSSGGDGNQAGGDANDIFTFGASVHGNDPILAEGGDANEDIFEGSETYGGYGGFVELYSPDGLLGLTDGMGGGPGSHDPTLVSVDGGAGDNAGEDGCHIEGGTLVVGDLNWCFDY
jgi:hypothetical protein